MIGEFPGANVNLAAEILHSCGEFMAQVVEVFIGLPGQRHQNPVVFVERFQNRFGGGQ